MKMHGVFAKEFIPKGTVVPFGILFSRILTELLSDRVNDPDEPDNRFSITVCS